MEKRMVRSTIKILLILLITTQSFAQTFSNDTTMQGTYNAGGKVMNIQAKISGNVTITNGIIEANPFNQIFDTSVRIGTNVQIREFSGRWYGANPSNKDNSRQLQIAIDQCINRYDLFIPAGNYKTTLPLMIAIKGRGHTYIQSTLNLYGESTFWSDKTKITYSGDSCAIGLQLNKGSRIHNITIYGGWVSPSGRNPARYYSTSFEDYTNQGESGNGVGIWVDPVGNWNFRSGSTACQIYDVKVSGFKTLIQIGNGITQNDEIILLNNIQFGNARVGLQSTQPQEKGNMIKGIYSWGSIHTILNWGGQAGNYYVDGMNIAGGCVRIFNVNQGGFFSSHFSNIYAENFGSIGNFSTSGLPINISNSVFDFKYKKDVGELTLLTSNSNQVKFDNCSFRYYGSNDNMKFSGKATFENCLFSGKVKGSPGSLFITYKNGQVYYNGSQAADMSAKDTLK